jgi:PAS domain S-box-containing protein/diguanylate cyclase (GGDEF)-like protein
MATATRLSVASPAREPAAAPAAVTVLAVEDSETDFELVRRHLVKSGLNCVIHRVSTEATFVEALHNLKPDIILSDFSMPRFDGVRALEIANVQAPDIPFLFVSGTIGEERAIDALHRGATDYILKTNLSRLGPAVERALREAQVKAAQRRAERELRANEQRLRDTIETSQDWIWEMDPQGRFTFCSGALARILGYEPADVLGKDFRIYLHEDDRATASSLLPAHGQGQLTGAVARWRAVDGQIRWLERNVVTMLDAAQQVVGFRGTERDITLRRDQEARLKRLTRTYRMLSSTGSAILRLHDRIDLLHEVCRIAVRQGGYDRAVISVVDPGHKVLRPRASAGADSDALRAFDRAVFDPQSDLMLDRTLRTGLRIVRNDLAGDQRSLPQREVLLAHGYQAFAALPVMVDDTPIGVITLCSSQRGVFDKAELSVLLELTFNLGFALQYLEKDEAVQFLSYFDSLTGLAKRSIFCQRLAQLLNSEAQAGSTRAVVAFDVQQLGAINDSLGRYVGDRLLENIAARLKEAYNNEAVAYLGNGTFALTFATAAKVGETGRIMQDAAARLFTQPLLIEGHALHPTVRSGVAFHPHDGNTAEALLQNAEAALRAAREDNERYLLYGMVRQRPTTRSVALEARLAGALGRNEFRLHYQPKIDIATGRPHSLEALLRWQDTQDGLVPPSLFIPLLERSGAIGEVGEWVLLQALRDLQQWAQAGLSTRVAINVSPTQLRRREFVERLLAPLRASSRAGIDIEITESTLMEDIELSIRKLAELRSAGVGVAIDDFGTGYSSLRLLARLPVDTLKIDGSFIQALSDTPTGSTLVGTIVSLAHAFGMNAVAEGVETAEQLESLRQLQCDQAQGYLIARPIPAADIPPLLARLQLPKRRE